MKRFFLDEHGCAKNQVDGEIIISNLLKKGYQRAASAEEADLIIVNSCGFIESAKKESLDAVVGARKQFPNKKIILAGCLAERYAKVFEKELPEADGIFGNGDLNQIDYVFEKVLKGRRAVLTPEQVGVCYSERTVSLSYKNSAYVKITEGCSNHCSFCAIPLIRGELRSRSYDSIVAEVKSLLKQGVFEINLIGQDLAAYGRGHSDAGFCAKSAEGVHKSAAARHKATAHSPLRQLLDKLSALKGDFWLRLLYIHPDHFDADILEAIKKDKRILPYFDIPFQSGDSGIIRAMNRKSAREEYIRLVKKIRRELPDAAVRTTFLTGFPGETDEAFENTLGFVKTIRADWAGCFTYSKEDDTPAAKMKNQIPKKTAAARQKTLLAEQEKITSENLSSRVRGKNSGNNRKNNHAIEYDVLIEEVLGEGFAIGRAWFQAPDVDGNAVVRFDTDDKNASLIKPGAVVRARAVATSGVDIDCVFVSGR